MKHILKISNDGNDALKVSFDNYPAHSILEFEISEGNVLQQKQLVLKAIRKTAPLSNDKNQIFKFISDLAKYEKLVLSHDEITDIEGIFYSPFISLHPYTPRYTVVLDA